MISFILIDKYKKHVEDMKRANRDMVWNFISNNETSQKEIDERRENGPQYLRDTDTKGNKSGTKDKDKGLHRCRFCDEDKPLNYTKHYWDILYLVARISVQFMGFLGIILVQHHWTAFILFVIYLVANAVVIFYEFMDLHLFMRTVKCGFVRINEIINLVILAFTIPGYIMVAIYFSYFVTTDHNFAQRFKKLQFW